MSTDFAFPTPLDDFKPSIFELLSEQQLSALLTPTLRYLLAVATHQHPRYLLRVLNSFDELYALLSLVVERHYLTTRGGSFTENFYGLKREKAVARLIPRASAAVPDAVRETLRLKGRDVWWNLAVLVGVPYLKKKLDEAYEVNAPRELLGSAYNRRPKGGAGIKAWITYYARWFLKNVYPSVNAAYHFSILAFSMGYLFDHTQYQSPFMWLIGTRIRRMGIADYRAIDKAAAARVANGRAGWGEKVIGSLSMALPTSIFLLKFLEWWYASDFAKQLLRKAAEMLDLPPPVVSGMPEDGLFNPTKPKSAVLKGAEAAVHGSILGDSKVDDGQTALLEKAPVAKDSLLPVLTVATPADSQLCPICEDEITTATACQTGIVYCYVCIFKWVDGQHAKQEDFMKDKVGKWENGAGRCAVTGRRVLGGTEGLRRIMV